MNGSPVNDASASPGASGALHCPRASRLASRMAGSTIVRSGGIDSSTLVSTHKGDKANGLPVAARGQRRPSFSASSAVALNSRAGCRTCCESRLCLARRFWNQTWTHRRPSPNLAARASRTAAAGRGQASKTHCRTCCSGPVNRLLLLITLCTGGGDGLPRAVGEKSEMDDNGLGLDVRAIDEADEAALPWSLLL